MAKRFGKRICALRTGLHMQQKELADAAGISAAMLSRIERGEREPRLTTAWRLTQGVGSSLDIVLREEQLIVTVTVQ